MYYSTRQFVLCLSLCYFVLVLFFFFFVLFFFFCHFSFAITSHREKRANLGSFHTFVRFAFVRFCLSPHPLGIWEGLRFVIVSFPGLFCYLFFFFFFFFFFLPVNTISQFTPLSVYGNYVAMAINPNSRF